MTMVHISSIAGTRRPAISLLGLVSLWKSRRALAGLSQEQLCDIGLSKTDAVAEAKRPVWDAPCNWMR